MLSTMLSRILTLRVMTRTKNTRVRDQGLLRSGRKESRMLHRAMTSIRAWRTSQSSQPKKWRCTHRGCSSCCIFKQSKTLICFALQDLQSVHLEGWSLWLVFYLTFLSQPAKNGRLTFYLSLLSKDLNSYHFEMTFFINTLVGPSGVHILPAMQPLWMKVLSHSWAAFFKGVEQKIKDWAWHAVAVQRRTN